LDASIAKDGNMTQLNTEQERIVSHLRGPLLVIAPVGTGKTRVLAERVVKAVQNGILAKRVLCLTFTNRAAQEMRARLEQYSFDAARQATVKTFHALCAHLLHLEARQIGLPADFVIYDDMDCQELVKDIFQIPNERDVKDMMWQLENCKVGAAQDQLFLNGPKKQLFMPLGYAHLAELAMKYQEALHQRHALDFADLIYMTRAMMAERLDIRNRWEERFDFVQVDEVQDTQITEYEIVQLLACRCRNIALIGDVDQTIYGWRGSEPDAVLMQYRADFDPVEYSLLYNYRATRTLLSAADSFASSFHHRYTKIIPARECENGVPIKVHQAQSEQLEGAWIASQIESMARGIHNFAYHRVAVLTRTNRRSQVVSAALKRRDIPHVTVEQYEFFRRQEIKDSLAYLHLVLNPFDTSALLRALLRPAHGIGDVTINKIMEDGEPYGLRLTDMIQPRTIASGDPYGDLLNAYNTGEIVVFDTETTGLSIEHDEIVELAGIRLKAGKPILKFQAFLKNTLPVGDSENVHHISDAFLAKNGRPASQVMQEFQQFCQGGLLVGHNVSYDIKMLAAHTRRLGLDVRSQPWADTWDIAHRFLQTHSYRLESLVEEYHLPASPTHRALDDVLATIELLNMLIPKISAHSEQRRVLVNRYGKAFVQLSQQVETWTRSMQRERPPTLLDQVLHESGLRDYYSKEPQRLGNLGELERIFRERDQVAQHPETALRALVEFTALSKNVDHLSANDNRLPVITIHQAKGLEFDTVFLAGATEGEMPDYRCNSDEKLEEEKHVFYVGMTRARRQLLISAHTYNDRGWHRDRSSFIDEIDPTCLEL
jgi:DNA helicase II / ATP-dependent DNA helicase PcrA